MVERGQKQHDEVRSAKASVSSEPLSLGKKRKVSEVDDTDLAVAETGSLAHLVGAKELAEEVELFDAPVLEGMGEVALLELDKSRNLAKLRVYFPVFPTYLSGARKQACEAVVYDTAVNLVAIAGQEGTYCSTFENYINSKGENA